MRSTGIIILLLFMGMTAMAQNNTLKRARELYQHASFYEDSAKVLFDMLSGKDYASEPILRAYQGASVTIQARYAWNPIQKLEYFNMGKALIEQAVKAAPNSWEIRYIRFTVQEGSPGILGYRSNLPTDKQVILEQLSSAVQNPSEVWIARQAALYLLQSETVSSSEKSKIRAFGNT